MNDLRVALALLTILHFPPRGSTVSARAMAYYPLVGLLLGMALAGAALLLRLLFPNLVVAAVLTALWAALTGGLHLDGFTDACDGLFAAASPARRLEILRDVHLGAFGAAGLILLLLTKFAAVSSLTSVIPLLLAPVLGRWAMVYAAAYPLARSEGMAFLFRVGLTRLEIMAATVTATVATFLAAFAVAPFNWFAPAAFAAAALVATAIARVALARLGGLTGDIYGMICESVELTVLLAGAAMVGAK